MCLRLEVHDQPGRVPWLDLAALRTGRVAWTQRHLRAEARWEEGFDVLGGALGVRGAWWAEMIAQNPWSCPVGSDFFGLKRMLKGLPAFMDNTYFWVTSICGQCHAYVGIYLQYICIVTVPWIFT